MAELTSAEERKLDNMGPEAKEASLGSKLGNMEEELGINSTFTGVDASTPILLTYELTADATTPLTMVTAPFAFKVVDVELICNATVGGGTVLISNGANAITDAITCAVDTTKGKAGTMDDAYTTIAAGGSLKITSANAGDRATVHVTVVRVN